MKNNFIIVFSFLLFLVSCDQKQEHYLNLPSEDFIIGAWRLDSTNEKYFGDRLPAIFFREYLSMEDGVTHVFSIDRNKEYYFKSTDFNIKDSIITYEEEQDYDMGIENLGQYAIRRTGINSFVELAIFDTASFHRGWPTVSYWSRIKNLTTYIDSLEKNGKEYVSDCNSIDLTKLYGYWKMDSEVVNSSISKSSNEYLFVDEERNGHFIWLGYKPELRKDVFRIKGKILIADSNQIPIICLDREKLVFESDRVGGLFQMNLSRINPDTIIPDSMRMDIKYK